METNESVETAAARKDALYGRFVKICRSALAEMQSFMDSEDIRFFEFKNGWDNRPGPVFGHVTEPMNAAELLIWMLENDAHLDGSSKRPFMYTDGEIREKRANLSLENIEDWRRQIAFLNERIETYRRRIADAGGDPDSACRTR